MQQYFMDRPLAVGETVRFSKEQAHHAGTVMRMDHETIRLVYEGKAFFACGYRQGKDFFAEITAEDHHVNELDCRITLAAALVRREKMELILQKACELGAARIVPFESSRCVARAVREKKERWDSIVMEAARQCKRNRIPEVLEAVPFSRLPAFKSEVNLACYENAREEGKKISQIQKGSSCTVVIGPEGGFSEEEITMLADEGFYYREGLTTTWCSHHPSSSERVHHIAPAFSHSSLIVEDHRDIYRILIFH